jgi:hypothetical protein
LTRILAVTGGIVLKYSFALSTPTNGKLVPNSCRVQPSPDYNRASLYILKQCSIKWRWRLIAWVINPEGDNEVVKL